MIVVRRGAVAAVVAGLVLLGGPTWAQEDPCAPGPDGQAPEMCQGGAAPEPGADTGTVVIDPCEGMRPAEPGDAVVSEREQAQGVAEGEPDPGTPSEQAPAEGEVEQEPRPEPDAPTMDAPVSHPAPGSTSDDGVICAFAGAPVSAPAAGGGTAVPESAAGSSTGVQNAAAAAGKLPRTGPYDQVLALAAIGSALLVLGAGALAAGRRRRVEA